MIKIFNKIISKVTFGSRKNITKYSFGATSAIISSLALITGLNINSSAKISVISSLLVIAIADNISDTLGIHIYQEGESLKNREVWISTLTNFLTRIFVVAGFILFIFIFPPTQATYLSIIYGSAILIFISFIIAKKRRTSIRKSIFEHLLIAFSVIIGTKLISSWIRNIY